MISRTRPVHPTSPGSWFSLHSGAGFLECARYLPLLPFELPLPLPFELPLPLPFELPLLLPFELPLLLPFELPLLFPFELPLLFPFELPLLLPFELPLLLPFELPLLFPFELPLLFPFELPLLFPFELPLLFPFELSLLLPLELPLHVRTEQTAETAPLDFCGLLGAELSAGVLDGQALRPWGSVLAPCALSVWSVHRRSNRHCFHLSLMHSVRLSDRCGRLEEKVLEPRQRLSRRKPVRA